MAEAFMRQIIDDRPALRHVEVFSAGTIAADGYGPLDQMTHVLRSDYGIDLVSHRSRRLSPGFQADLVLGMDQQVTREARDLGVSGDLHLIGDYAGKPGQQVADPYGGSLDDHRRCAATVKRLVEAVAARLEREAVGAD
jgi:protein-tyrosine-phosphatase